MEFSITQNITEEIIAFINQEWIKQWLIKGMFKNIYKEALKEKLNIGRFTHWLYSLGINPLEYDLTCIPESFLEGNDYLVKINIPEKITKIEESAFYGCGKITEITLPKNISKIDAWSLAHMIQLKEITIEGKLLMLDSLGIYDNPNIEVIYSIPANKETLMMNVTELKAGAARFQEI